MSLRGLVAGEADERLQLGMTEAVINQLACSRALRVEPLARIRAHDLEIRIPWTWDRHSASEPCCRDMCIRVAAACRFELGCRGCATARR